PDTRNRVARPAKPLLDLAKRRRLDFLDGGMILSDRGAGSSNGVSSAPSKSQTRSRSSNVKWHSGQRFMAQIANSNSKARMGQDCGAIEADPRLREYTHPANRTTTSR